jgi:hypothetical protein
MINHDATKILKHNLVFHVLLVVPLAYFAGAAFAAVKVLQVGQFYGPSMEEETLSLGELNTINEWCLNLNQMTGSIKANWAWASFACLRNAIIGLLILAVVGTFFLN